MDYSAINTCNIWIKLVLAGNSHLYKSWKDWLLANKEWLKIFNWAMIRPVINGILRNIMSILSIDLCHYTFTHKTRLKTWLLLSFLINELNYYQNIVFELIVHFGRKNNKIKSNTLKSESTLETCLKFRLQKRHSTWPLIIGNQRTKNFWIYRWLFLRKEQKLLPKLTFENLKSLISQTILVHSVQDC